MGTTNRVYILHKRHIDVSTDGGKTSSIVLLPESAQCHKSELVYSRQVGSLFEPAGQLYTVMYMDPQDEQELVQCGEDIAAKQDIKVAVSEGEGDGNNYLVSTMWDWGP